jgi:TetR/AcrR family transcriptional regulator
VSSTRPRLTAEERRAAVLDCACGIFAKGSYRGTTTAEIARQAGVTEPILYRHFESKRDLYLACLDAAWEDTQQMWEDAVSNEPDPAFWVTRMGEAYLATKERKGQVANLWIQALTEAGDDPEIRRFLKRHMTEVHDHIADVMRRSQAAGGILPDRDPSAEAWIFISLGLLGTVGRRLGGVVGEDFPQIMAARRRWMTGRDA